MICVNVLDENKIVSLVFPVLNSKPGNFLLANAVILGASSTPIAFIPLLAKSFTNRPVLEPKTNIKLCEVGFVILTISPTSNSFFT